MQPRPLTARWTPSAKAGNPVCAGPAAAASCTGALSAVRSSGNQGIESDLKPVSDHDPDLLLLVTPNFCGQSLSLHLSAV